MPIAQVPCAVIAVVLRQAEIDTAGNVASVLVTCSRSTFLLTVATLSRRGTGTKVYLCLPVNVCRERAGMAVEAWLFNLKGTLVLAITVGLLSSLLAIRIAGARGT